MRLALLASLSASLLATACADDAHDSATFATATDAQLLRAIDVATFADVELMLEIGGSLYGRNQPGCPAVSTTGLVTTVTTDCTTDNGWAVTGKLVITNFGFEDGVARDPAQPSSVEAFGLRATRDDRFQTLDGEVSVSFEGTTTDLAEVTAAIDVSDNNLVAHTDGVVRCASGTCTFAEGWIGVDTLGEATIDPSSNPEEQITLHGQQTLVVPIERDAEGCYAATVDGAARQICDATQRRAPNPWRTILR